MGAGTDASVEFSGRLTARAGLYRICWCSATSHLPCGLADFVDVGALTLLGPVTFLPPNYETVLQW